MNRDEIVELAAGYALGGLEADERTRFEALLRSGDREATSALSEFEGALAALAAADAAAPPAGVKQALLARLGAGARPAPAIALAERRRRSPWLAVWAGGAAAGIAAILVGMSLSATYERRLSELDREATGLRTEVEQLRGEIDQQRALLALIRDPATQVVSLAGQPGAPGAQARMLWNRGAGGFLVAAGLPALPEGKTYQLWAIAGTAAPVPAGTFAVDASGGGSLRVPLLRGAEAVDVFAVTVEPAGGLPAPSGPLLLAGKA